MAGGGCLIGCEAMVAAATTARRSSSEWHSGHDSARKATIAPSGHACSSGRSRDSKKARQAKPEVERTSKSDTALVTLGGSSSGMIKDCPLGVGRAAIAAKVRTKEVAAAPVLTNSILPAENVIEQTSPLSPPARLPNRGHTYLRCCVFLI